MVDLKTVFLKQQQVTIAIVLKFMVGRIAQKELGFVFLTTLVRIKVIVFTTRTLQTTLVDVKVDLREGIVRTISMSVHVIPQFVIPLTGKQLVLI